MSPSTGIPNESRRRPRSTGLQLPDMRQGRPQLTLSDPSTMAPYSAPPGVVPPGSVSPGVVPPGAVPHASVGSSSAVHAAPAPYVRRREDALLRAPSRRNQPHLHPDKINGALFGIDPEVHALSEQHGRETIGGHGQAGTSFHLRRRISAGMRSFNTTTGRTNSMMKST
uniref:Uncharacterized protein n=1 Tax=Brassica oleracea var. oleracea TaxID=109376 RepID=A0A0D3BVP9_BRAOL